LIIGSVGSGKSTYLAHFEHVAAAKLIKDTQANWVYIDYEKMGPDGSPRGYLYSQLLAYLSRMDYESVVEPAYHNEISGLAKGPLSPIYGNKSKFDEKIADYILRDYNLVEPYVDKLFSYLAKDRLTIVVLDNVDLYEDSKLESLVFAEGLAFSKRVHCHVIVCIRDTTFIRHRTDSVFDAYELRKLWLDPPPFRQVLSTRLEYSRKILDGKHARIPTSGGAFLDIQDLGVFFEIVQKSLLSNEAGIFIEALADLNIRKGLTLVTNFLTSGHIQANKALGTYLTKGGDKFWFPFHEVFKGTMLGQWRHVREDRTECVNLFDARVGSRKLRLLRLQILKYLMIRARNKDMIEVPIQTLVDDCGILGATVNVVLDVLRKLQREHLIMRISIGTEPESGSVAITRSGGYYISRLIFRLVYVEECMHDTAIDDDALWHSLSDMTYSVELEYSVVHRMEIRKNRIDIFTKYLESLEQEILSVSPQLVEIGVCSEIRRCVLKEMEEALSRSRLRYT
ncbi:hypothetical protein HGB13_04945, partial [bacterium]|nr:hypothetical protein [bacterium]